MISSSSSVLLIPLLFVVVLVIQKGVEAKKKKQRFELPPLPYNYDALEPHIGKQTLEIHHGKHHAKYVNTLSSFLESSTEEDWKDTSETLEDIVKKSYKLSNEFIFNNAAQSWNHEFYWNCMTPKFKAPPKKLMVAIERDFGTFQNFKSEFSMAGNTAFGSGWAWLVYDASSPGGGKLFVTKTIGADNPMAQNDDWIPILTMDVWEHAYYLDYQNLRPKYVDIFFDKLVNWKFVASNYETAEKKKKAASSSSSNDGEEL